MLAGVALMVAFALLFGVWVLRVDPATSVLAVGRSIPAGAVISEADLQVVRMVPAPGMEVLTEAERAAVVGRTAAVPLMAGTLLMSAHLGAATWPPAGQSVVAVPAEAGRVPAGLTTGSRVNVLLPADDQPVGDGTAAGRAEPAVVSANVVAVAQPSAAGVSTVSLLLASRDARRVAAAGEVVLILEPPGDR